MEPKHKNPPAKYDYSPVTFSMETAGGISTPLIRRGTPLPSNRTLVFSTLTDNQKAVETHILLGERPLSKYNISIGRYLLDKIAPAKAGESEIRVIVDVDKLCNVKVETLDTKSGERVEAKFSRSKIKLTDALVDKLISDAQTNKTRDDAELTIAQANLRVQQDQRNNKVTSTTTQIEQQISELGIALMEDSRYVYEKTQRLKKLLQSSSTFNLDSYSSIFDSLFSPKSSVKQENHITKQPVSQSQAQKPKESSTPVSTPLTHTTALIQSFLEQISQDLESKRSGAWQALESGTQDGPAQATHSMREVLRQILDNLAPTADVQKAPWYKKLKEGPPVTRAMKIRYAITGTSDVESESTLSLINGMSDAVNSMYAKLSAESHSGTRLKISTVRMYLNACEALIGLIATERRP